MIFRNTAQYQFSVLIAQDLRDTIVCIFGTNTNSKSTLKPFPKKDFLVENYENNFSSENFLVTKDASLVLNTCSFNLIFKNAEKFKQAGRSQSDMVLASGLVKRITAVYVV